MTNFVTDHPLFGSIQKRIINDEFTMTLSTELWTRGVDFYFKCGWRKGVIVEMEYNGFDSDEVSITRTRFYVKPGFLQPRVWIDTALIPEAVVDKLKELALDAIQQSMNKQERSYHNKVADALDNL